MRTHTLLAAFVLQLLAAQTPLHGASRIGANIDEVLATLTNVALKEKISRFASAGGADRKLDSFEADVSIVDGAERYDGVRGHHRTYRHVSEISGLWSFGEIVTMLRTTRDILGASAAQSGEESPGWRVIRFRAASADHKWFVSARGRTYWLDFEGAIRISSRTGEIERLTWNSAAGPPGSGIASVLWDVTFGVANVADVLCTMPSDSIFRVVRTGLDRSAEWNLTQYAAVGRYGSTVSVSFGE